MQLIRLRPRSAVHTWPSNQTLFGAVCWAVSTLNGSAKLEELLGSLKARPQELVLSSCMPVIEVGDSQAIFLVPKPVSWHADLPNAAKAGRIDAKRLKRARWASVGAVSAAGSPTPAELCLSDPDLIETPVVLLRKEQEALVSLAGNSGVQPMVLWRGTEESHNTLSRLTGATTPPGRLYFTSGWDFSTWCGLYALVHAEGGWTEVWEAALRFACDTGLGGRRGTGRASYELGKIEDAQELGFVPKGNMGGWLALGRVVVPRGAGLDLSRSVYDLSLAHSRVDSGASGREVFKRPTVQLEPGAVLVAGTDGSETFWGEAGGWRVCGGVLATGYLGGPDAPDGEKVPVYTYGVAPCVPTVFLSQQGAQT